MRTATIITCMLLLIISACKEKPSKDNPEMEQDKQTTSPAAEEWEILFDGTSMDSWKGYRSEDVPATWKIEDGAMVFYPPENGPEGESYNLVSRKDYTNFVLSLEWRISEGGNSGIFWGIMEDPKYGQPYETGPEIQVLDNGGHPDASNGDTHQAGALYDMVAPATDVTNPPGEWNQCEITVNYTTNKGKVVLNGEEILSFPLGNDAWDAMVEKSKFKGWEGFGKFQTGKIGLQDHGDVVAYRNIRIKSL
ncbi:3-keto-disaccharide hydrolase [Robiginitalea aurantiaca]|uniref:DUF1080 domain-containing protein n=1 Tax=Robiginitalea aurantiaca TaxID=3056915 RepID=A0ABT7WAV7_9FLAO|nr:DUF1080 domain-containing protein [Robiginitalea aurantiaca]MDM9630040.1 DUF1080 domain-containing protein [Robiginitalea aurantiaca]